MAGRDAGRGGRASKVRRMATLAGELVVVVVVLTAQDVACDALAEA